MKKFRKISLLYVLPILLIFSSCEKDLDISPKDDDDFTSEKFFANPSSYKQFMAKIYGGLALTGQANSAGNGDLGDPAQGALDEGYTQYIRGWWQLQEVSTDEAIIAWTDPTLPDLSFNTWNADNVYIEGFFARVFYQIGLCNEFLRETTEEKLSSRGVSEDLKIEVRRFRAEARFMRALSYYHGIDTFGNLPFGTENDLLGTPPPMQTRQFIFDYCLSELDAINGELAAPRTNEYARADQAAAWMLKAKLLINAKVYTGTDRSADALIAVNQVINSGYAIATIPFANLFKADNNVNGAQNEAIFPIAYDGARTQSFGGTTFLVHGGANNTIAATLGVDNGWGGFRVRQEFVNTVGNSDARVMYVPGNSDPASITNPTTATSAAAFDEGRKLIKFSNIKSDGNPGANATYPDTDFPLFRMADAYLMYAELAANGFGDVTTAVGYVNTLRLRGSASTATITSAELTPDLVLNERAKELYWEGYRRQDLIRFGKYLSAYNWQWKGGAQSGVALPEYRLLFPIPTKELNTNPNLRQNPGY